MKLSFLWLKAKAGGVSRLLQAILETSVTSGIMGVGFESGRGDFGRIVLSGLSALAGIRQKLLIISR